MISHSLHNHVKPEPIALHISHSDITEITGSTFILIKIFYFFAHITDTLTTELHIFLSSGNLFIFLSDVESGLRDQMIKIFNFQLQSDLHQNFSIEFSI